ncbi:MAG TPA: FG-GAP repeat protein [Herpetosiphonaceae bacterium]|nr:FG-GAP repeat protein [Herpetosiphonaceae bacterium]
MHPRIRVGLLLILVVGLSIAQAKGGAAAPPAGASPAGPVPWPQAYLKSAPMHLSNKFGSSLASSGDTVVVGSSEEGGVGAVHVFVPDTINGGWVRQSRFGAFNASPYDRFGGSLAIDGDTLVVGAPWESGNGLDPADNSVGQAGAVYVYVRSNGLWTQQAYLKASNIGVQHMFGYSVDIDGDTIVVGALGDDSTVAGGAAYVFTRTGGVWSQQGYLKASNAEYGDQFGFRVAIDDGVVVVSAIGERSNGSGPDDNSVMSAGAVYTFERSNGAWSQREYLKSPYAASTTQGGFGGSTAIDDGTLVIAGGGSNAFPGGSAFVYVRPSGPLTPTWTIQATLSASNGETGDGFGGAVIDGDTIVVGVGGEDSNGSGPADNSAMDSGAVYVFGRNGSIWTELSYRKAFNADPLDIFGGSLSLSDGILAVGAFAEDGSGLNPYDNSQPEAGAVYVQQIGARLFMPVLTQLQSPGGR